MNVYKKSLCWNLGLGPFYPIKFKILVMLKRQTWLKRNKIKYDSDKFIEEIEDVEDLMILKSKDTVKDFFPDMKKLDVYKIIDAVKKMTLSSKPETPTTKEEKIRAMLKGANLRPVDSQKREIEDSVKEMEKAKLRGKFWSGLSSTWHWYRRLLCCESDWREEVASSELLEGRNRIGKWWML